MLCICDDSSSKLFQGSYGVARPAGRLLLLVRMSCHARDGSSCCAALLTHALSVHWWGCMVCMASALVAHHRWPLVVRRPVQWLLPTPVVAPPPILFRITPHPWQSTGPPQATAAATVHRHLLLVHCASAWLLL